jgi:type III restriction enzyme
LACERITRAVTTTFLGTKPVHALPDPYSPSGSTRSVHFHTSKALRWQTRADRSHVNWAVLDSDWEGELCRVVEGHPRVLAYVKNQGLGFRVPYQLQGEKRHYLPDFIVLVDDGRGPDDPLHLVVEIKGYRGEDAKEKKGTMDTYWVPGVNRMGTFGRWAFSELTEVYRIESDFEAKVARHFDEMLSRTIDTVAPSET